MSDYGDICRALRDAKREHRSKFGVLCPECKRVRPKAHPSILLPQQRCKVDGYRDPRPRGETYFDAIKSVEAPCAASGCNYPQGECLGICK